jgi:hypothetical protein
MLQHPPLLLQAIRISHMNPDNGLDDRGIWVRFPIVARESSAPTKSRRILGLNQHVDIGGFACLGLGKVEKRKSLNLPGLVLRLLGRPVCS